MGNQLRDVGLLIKPNGLFISESLSILIVEVDLVFAFSYLFMDSFSSSDDCMCLGSVV